MKEAALKERDATGNSTKLERELATVKRDTLEEMERAKLKYERKIQFLETELEDYRNKVTKSETRFY